jgi:hypothetical protein
VAPEKIPHGFIYNTFGLGARHMGFRAGLGAPGLPGLAHGLEPAAHEWRPLPRSDRVVRIEYNYHLPGHGAIWNLDTAA